MLRPNNKQKGGRGRREGGREGREGEGYSLALLGMLQSRSIRFIYCIGCMFLGLALI